jgi:hypothetical protein
MLLYLMLGTARRLKGNNYGIEKERYTTNP